LFFFGFFSHSMDDHLEELRKCLWDATAMVHALMARRAARDPESPAQTLCQLQQQLTEANRLHALLTGRLAIN
jgi:hypothetical protein